MLIITLPHTFIRSRRRRCQTPAFGTACTFCTARNLPCTRDTQSINRPARTPTDGAQQLLASIPNEPVSSPHLVSEDIPQSNGLPSKALCLELANLYFDYIHDQFHSLFHRPSLLRDIEAGVTPPVIVFAMIALSAR